MSFLQKVKVAAGKHGEAERTGKCYNCDKYVGSTNLVVNDSTRWPVCEECDQELDMDNDEEED